MGEGAQPPNIFTVAQVVKKLTVFMERENSSP
jgi:hypothetical protein